MPKDGLMLLLRFAIGPIESGLCCDNEIFKQRVKNYLQGDDAAKTEIEKEIPQQLKNAWHELSQIANDLAKEPLDWETVSAYVLGDDSHPPIHNLVASEECCVLEEIYDEMKFKFFLPFDDLKKGDKILVHRGWVVAKKNEA